MVEKTYLLTVRDVPKSVNAGGGGARTNHYVASKEKKRWQGVYTVEFMVAKLEKCAQFVTVDIVVKWKRDYGRDVENYRHPIVKPLADALVAYGVIKEDTDEWFAVRDVRFEYPEDWPFKRDPRVTGVMDLTIEASYA